MSFGRQRNADKGSKMCRKIGARGVLLILCGWDLFCEAASVRSLSLSPSTHMFLTPVQMQCVCARPAAARRGKWQGLCA